MIDLLIGLIIFCIIGGLLYYLVMLLPLPAPFKTIVQVAFILIAILVLLSYFTGYLPGPYHEHAVVVR